MHIYKQRLTQNPPKVLMDQVNNIWYHATAWSLSATSSQAVWQIRRVTPPFTVEYADGNTRFDNVWDDRLSLSYS